MLVMDRTYEFINWTMIPYLTYQTYDQMYFSFANPMQSFKVMWRTCVFFNRYVQSKTFPPYPSVGQPYSPNYLSIQIIQVYFCVGFCMLQGRQRTPKFHMRSTPYSFYPDLCLDNLCLLVAKYKFCAVYEWYTSYLEKFPGFTCICTVHRVCFKLSVAPCT